MLIVLAAVENLVPYSDSRPQIFKSQQLVPVKDLKLLVRDYTVGRKGKLRHCHSYRTDPQDSQSLRMHSQSSSTSAETSKFSRYLQKTMNSLRPYYPEYLYVQRLLNQLTTLLKPCIVSIRAHRKCAFHAPRQPHQITQPRTSCPFDSPRGGQTPGQTHSSHRPINRAL